MAGCLVSGWVGSLSAQSGDIRFTHLSVEHGLASTSVYTITQTPDGFLWIGTQNGLHRYDGYHFKVFNFIPGDTTSLSDNWVKALTLDAAGNLWVATNNGLNRYNRETETFTTYFSDVKNPFSLPDNNLWNLFKDSKGTLWVGTNNGLSRYDAANQRFVSYRIVTSNGSENNAINAMAEDKTGNFWVGTWGSGIFRFDRTQGTFTPFAAVTGRTEAEGQYVKVLKADRQGRLWIGMQGSGLHVYDPRSKSYTVFQPHPEASGSITDKAILSILEDSQGTIWAGTYHGGLNRYVEAEGKFISYQNDPLKPHSLQGTWITSLFEDQSGGIWAGHDNGLSRFDRKGPKFLLFQNNPEDRNSIPKSNINVIHEDRDGLLWFGMWGGGLSSFDLQSRTFTHYVNHPDNPNSLVDDRVWGIAEDASGMLWIATSRGLDKFDKQSGRFEHRKNVSGKPSIPATQLNILSCIESDGQGRFWIGTWGGGLYIYDPKTDSTIHLRHDRNDSNTLSHNQIKHVLVDTRGTAWISTFEGGLNRLTTDSRGKMVVRRYTYNSRNPKNLGSNSTRVVFEDRRHTIWVGTEGGGLSRFDPETETFHRVKMPGNTYFLNSVTGILEDKAGALWLSTNRGIVRYFPAANQFKLYDVMDGLQSNNFLSNGCQTRNGLMLFGGHNGFNVFDPQQIKESSYAPPVVINELRVFNETVEAGKAREDHAGETPLLDKPLFLHSRITLSYKEYVFSLGFTALDFTAPQKNQYAYKLEGFEDKWNYTDAGQRFATYTNLSPGEYLFTVKGTNSDGVWNKHPAVIKVIITPPFWLTWWAYLLYGLTGAGILFVLKRYTERRERLKNELELKRMESEKLQEVDQLKTRFFTNISHEFRTPLTLILGPLEKKLSGITPGHPDGSEFRMMHRNAHRLLQLINQLLEVSKLETGDVKLEPSKGDLLPFLRSIAFSFSSLAESKQIQLEFYSPHSHLWAFFDRDKIEKITVNLLSNAFKFTGEGGKVSLKVQVAGGKSGNEGAETVELVVEDTGIGIPADRTHKIFDRFYQVDSSHTRERGGTGIGLALTRELVLLHRGEIEVASEPGRGTAFTVRLPIGLKFSNDTISAELPEKTGAVPLTTNHRTHEPEFIHSEEIFVAGDQAPLLLIVEDNDEVRRYIRESFEASYRIIESANGQEGLEKAIETLPDLIITDLMMPRLDGIELCRHLKTDERTSHVPVILLTARASVESRLDGLETGADDYLTKPFHPQELRVRVRNLIEGRRKLRERFAQEVKQPPKPMPDPVLSAEEKFLQKAIGIVEKHLSESEFSVEDLEKEMYLSKMQLYRKLKALIDQTPNEFIRNIRLKRAATLIRQRTGNISEIAYEVGFNNLSYFAKCFRERYGVTPSEYASSEKDVVG